MKLQFFAVPAMQPEGAVEALNGFLGTHRVVGLDRQFVSDGASSFWSVCVSYLDASQGAPAPFRKEKVDYRQVLDERDFLVYAELRALRKTIAEQDGLPAYALFTNEQLAEMVTRRAVTTAAMGEIEGIGKARLEKYGATFAATLARVLAPTGEAKQ